MPVITLTTEWQGYDYFNGVLKGKLATLCPGAIIIDNATSIPPFNIQHTAFVVRNTFRHYPEGSVHIICVNSEYHEDQPHLIVKSQGHYFISADNGVFYLILNAEPESIAILEKPSSELLCDELDVFAKAASTIINGGDISDAGKSIPKLHEKVPLRATIEDNAITGSIIFIDSYGNAISNITRDLFKRIIEGKKFHIAIRSNKNLIYHISESYKSEPISDLIARFNSLDLLEIGINGVNAAELMSLKIGDAVRIALQDGKSKPGALF